MREMNGVFLNLGPPSKVSAAEAKADLEAILSEDDLDFVVGVEGVLKGALAKAPDGWEKVRNLKNQSTANLYGYFKGKTGPVMFHTMKKRFAKEPPRKGLHVPRSYFKVNFRGVKFLVAHQPPGWPGTYAARAEHAEDLRHELAPWKDEARWKKLAESTQRHAHAKQQILLWDRNMSVPEHRAFAFGCDSEPHGVRIDSIVTRLLADEEVTYGRRVGPARKQTVHTDHPWGAARIKFRYV